MIRNGILTLTAFVSTMFLPWPFTVLLALIVSFSEPLVPFAIGLFADALYYAPVARIWPLYSLYGGVVTLIVFFVRSQLRAGTIE